MRRRIIAVVIAVVALAGIAAVAVRSRDDAPPTERAIALLGTETRFDSSTEAVQSFALVYHHLADATRAFPKDCGRPTGKGRCLALNQAAGWSLSFSPASGHCTQPAVQQGRLALLGYVRRSQALDESATEPPPLPPIPIC